MSATRLVVPVATVFGLLAAGLALADDSVPSGPVKEAYAITVKTLAGRGAPPWRPPHRDKLMTQDFAALFARDDLFQDEAGEMGHVHQQPGPDPVGDAAELGEIENAGIGGPAGDDQLGSIFIGQLLHLRHVDAVSGLQSDRTVAALVQDGARRGTDAA